MARPLATQEIVFDAASALVADGVQPTIVTVQAKIGGGSYTTIKRLLDKWHAERAHLHEAALEVPGVVEEKCAELGIPVLLSKEPTDCAALGLGNIIENYDLLQHLGRNSFLHEF